MEIYHNNIIADKRYAVVDIVTLKQTNFVYALMIQFISIIVNLLFRFLVMKFGMSLSAAALGT